MSKSYDDILTEALRQRSYWSSKGLDTEGKWIIGVEALQVCMSNANFQMHTNPPEKKFMGFPFIVDHDDAWEVRFCPSYPFYGL